MAGHSKWANIKHRKAAKDAKKGQAFAKCSREIMKAAKLGGPDPEGNFRLRTAIDKGKAAGLPNDNINRAIEKGTGTGGADELDEMTYEGYGAGGVAVFIECMSDNKNRTAGDIRSYFNKYDGNLGADGCVAWMFEQMGLIQISTEGHTEESVFELAVEAGAHDVARNDDENVFELTTNATELDAVCRALSEKEATIVSADLTRNPQNTIEITDESQAKQVLKLLDAIESHDDVQNVYANFDMDDELLAVLDDD